MAVYCCRIVVGVPYVSVYVVVVVVDGGVCGVVVVGGIRLGVG